MNAANKTAEMNDRCEMNSLEEIGRAWAEREAEMLTDHGRAIEGPWFGTVGAAYACLPGTHARNDQGEFVPLDEDVLEAEAEAINEAADKRWQELLGGCHE
jgi:hypothetical protein